MKIHSFIFAIAAAGLATTAAHADPEVKYDRFKKQTTVTSDKLYAVGSQTYGAQMPQHFINAIAVLQDSREHDSMAFAITNFHAGGWAYLQCSDVSWLVDDQPFDFGKMQPRRDTMHGDAVAEEFMGIISHKQLAQLAAAKKIEWKICNDEFKLNDEGVAHIRKFLSVLDEQLLKVGPAKDPL